MTIKYFKDEILYKRLSVIKKDETFYSKINEDNVGVMNKKGNTLLFTKLCSSKERIDYILSLGVDLNKRNELQENALFYATSFEKLKILLDLNIEKIEKNIYKKDFFSSIIFLMFNKFYYRRNNDINTRDKYIELEKIYQHSIKKLNLDVEELYKNISNNFYVDEEVEKWVKFILIKNGKINDYSLFKEIGFYSYDYSLLLIEYFYFSYQKTKNNEEEKKLLIKKVSKNFKLSNIIYSLFNFFQEDKNILDYKDFIDFIVKEAYSDKLCWSDLSQDYTFSYYSITSGIVPLSLKEKIKKSIELRAYLLKIIDENNLNIKEDINKDKKLYDFYNSEIYYNQIDKLTIQDIVINSNDALFYLFIGKSIDEIVQIFENFVINNKKSNQIDKIKYIYEFIEYHILEIKSQYSKRFYSKYSDEFLYVLYTKYNTFMFSYKEKFVIKNMELFKTIINDIKSKKSKKEKQSCANKLLELIHISVKSEEVPYYLKELIYQNFSIYLNQEIRNINLIDEYYDIRGRRNIITEELTSSPNIINETLNTLRKSYILNDIKIKNIKNEKSDLFLLMSSAITNLSISNEIEEKNINYLIELFKDTQYASFLDKYIISKKMMEKSDDKKQFSKIFKIAL